MDVLFYAYLLLMLFFGFLSFRKVKNYKDFTLAGANQGTLSVSLSLLATIIGGTATFGLASLVEKKGFPAFWWLGSGAFFLILQAFLLAKPVRRLNAYSLPHLARLVIGRKASLFISVIICMTWLGIVAAQFIALGQLLSVISPDQNPKHIIALVALFVIAYTLLGGQFSIIKTDGYQFLILFCTLVAVFFLMYFSNYFFLSEGESLAWLDFSLASQNLAFRFELFNENFQAYDFFSIFLVGGLAFFVGPDIFSRNLSAKDEKTAQKSALIAGFMLFIFALLMTYVAHFALFDLKKVGEANFLTQLISHHLPAPLAIFLTLGLISALISSADTCLMSTATILSHDIFQSKDIRHSRLIVLLVGAAALILALTKSNIIGLLFASYSVYVPGVVLPLAFAIYFHGKRPLHLPFLLFAIGGGSFLGFLGNIIKVPELSLYGIAFSCFLSLFALFYQKKLETRLCR